MRYSSRLILSFVAVTLLTAQSQSAPPAKPGPLKITEPRNAAAGFAITLWMSNVDALGTHCSKLEGQAGTQSMQALKLWQKRNMPYVDAVLSYMQSIEDPIKSNQGKEARKKFRAARTAEFNKSARDSEAAWFPNAQASETSCAQLSRTVDSGALDVDQNAEFFPTLEEIKADMEKRE